MKSSNGYSLAYDWAYERNKVKYIIDKVDLIHSVDSVRLAETIDKEAEKHGVIANILIEVNVAKEEVNLVSCRKRFLNL